MIGEVALRQHRVVCRRVYWGNYKCCIYLEGLEKMYDWSMYVLHTSFVPPAVLRCCIFLFSFYFYFFKFFYLNRCLVDEIVNICKTPSKPKLFNKEKCHFPLPCTQFEFYFSSQKLNLHCKPMFSAAVLFLTPRIVFHVWKTAARLLIPISCV